MAKQKVNKHVVCRRIINCGRNDYGRKIFVVLFMENNNEFIWKTTNKTKAINIIEEGREYNIECEIYENSDYIDYVKVIN